MRTFLSVVLALLLGVFAESNFSVTKLAAKALREAPTVNLNVDEPNCTCNPCNCCPACPGQKK